MQGWVWEEDHSNGYKKNITTKICAKIVDFIKDEGNRSDENWVFTSFLKIKAPYAAGVEK